MATQSKVVIYNPTTMRHEPLAIYNNDTVSPIDATNAQSLQATTKVVLEFI